MPELPEVETMVRGVRSELLRRRILKTEFCRCSRKPISTCPAASSIVRRTKGLWILDVRRLAKRIVLQLGPMPEALPQDRSFLVIEPRMTGLMLISDPPTAEHRRVCWHLEPVVGRASRFEFWDRRGLGTISWLGPADFQTLTGRLGPDALAASVAEWRQLLSRTRREIKVALLDQSLVAGIGNLYASEILHLAGISPFRSAPSLRGKAVERLREAVQTVLADAIRCEGSTLSDGTYRNALNKAGGYQNHHRVYQRVGEACPGCRSGRISRVVQAQRATFYCAKCQR